MFATEGRRQPTLIGKDVSGHRLPGGPYTLWQGVATLAVLVAAWSGQELWADQRSPIAVALTCAALAALAGYLAGYIDPAKRNIALQLTGWLPAFYRATRPNSAALPRGVRRSPGTAPSTGNHLISLPSPETTATTTVPPHPPAQPTAPLPAATPSGNAASGNAATATSDQLGPAPTSTSSELALTPALLPDVTASVTARVSPLEAFLGARERIAAP